MRAFLRRLFPVRQTSRCLNGHLISERWRRPCPACGSLNRLIRVGWHEAVASSDRMGASDG